MKRRTFIHNIFAAGVLVGTPMIEFVKTRPARWIEAVRRHAWPGKVTELDEREVRRPGRWKG